MKFFGQSKRNLIEFISKLFGIGVGVTALLTLFTPAAANMSVYALIAVRVVEGLFEVMMFNWRVKVDFWIVMFFLHLLGSNLFEFI